MSAITTALLLVLGLCPSAPEPAVGAGLVQATPRHSTGRQLETATEAAIQSSVEGASVTLVARDAELGRVLGVVARQAGLIIESESPLLERIDIDQRGVPLAQVLEQLLAGHGFVLQLVESPELGMTGRVWIFESGTGTRASDRPPSNPSLAEKLLSDEPAAALAEMSRLLEAGEPAGEQLLIELAQRGQSVAVREEAIYALAEVGGPLVLATLESLLLDASSRLRSAAIDALGDIGSDDAAWALARALSDEQPELREQAVLTLGSLGSDAAIADAAIVVLEQALFDSDEAVRSAATELLTELLD